jgi:5-formyltetrahydrofolate cyclo-ligase
LERQEAAKQASILLSRHPFFHKSTHIACYMAYQDEFQTRDVIQTIWQHQKKCYLPVLTENKTLKFYKYLPEQALLPNQFGILEPDQTTAVIQAERIELVIMPLLAFDLEGNRLGTGGGYYDRTFAFLHSHPLQMPILLGIAYAFQQAERLPSDAWDIKLAGIVTEKEIIEI